MIVDFHTHVFPDALAKKAIAKLLEISDSKFLPVSEATAGALLSYMERNGIDRAVLQPVVTKASQVTTLNDWAASLSGDRIVSFGGIYPHSQDYRQAVDYVVSLGLKGLKFHSEYQDFVLDDPKMLPIYDYALSRGLILLFHAGYDPAFPPPFRSSPKMFANVLDAMRGGTIVAAHLGGHGDWEDVLRHLAGRDIYLDTSMGFEFVSEEVFVKVAKEHGAQRILFGTDFPWSDAANEISALRSMPLSEAEKELIFYGNAARLLGFTAN